MTHYVHIVPHTHFDAEVFINREATLQIGFSNIQDALRLLRSDPDFRFTLDQACYLEPYLRQHPEERRVFVEFVESGRIEIAGGTYVMPDLNLPSGESFIRQVLHGREFFEKELGVDVKAGWTIDSFGHHPQIPQLMLKSGFDYTVFQRVMRKNGPSEFFYRGLDGAMLRCHWMPVGYVVLRDAPGNLYEFGRFLEPKLEYLAAHARSTHLLALTGSDLTPPEPGLSRLVREYNECQDRYRLIFSSSREFFEAVEWNDAIPVVEEDLNPVFQGCYSARIEVKQENRELERLMTDWEKVDAMGRLLGIPETRNRRDAAWKNVLFNQFHDIIAGSHVDEVFFAAKRRFDHARSDAGDCIDAKLRAICRRIDTRGEGVPIVVFNTLGWERRDPVECTVVFSEPDVYDLEVRNARGEVVPSDLMDVERFACGGIRKTTVLFIANDVPAFGHEVYRVVRSTGVSSDTSIETSDPLGVREDKASGFIANEFYRLTFDLWNGLMIGFYDRVNGWESFPIRSRSATPS